MNSIKCNNCGLQNFASDTECRRCRSSIVPAAHKRKEKTPRRFSVWSLLMIAAVLAVVYYFYTGVENSVGEVEMNETRRLSSQPAPQATQGLSRTQYDQQRAGHYGDAVKNSQSLNAHQKRVEETEKAVQQLSNAK